MARKEKILPPLEGLSEGARGRDDAFTAPVLEWNGIGVSCELLMVEPEQAAAWLEDAHYDQQRRLRAAHVEELAKTMLGRAFKTGAIEFYMWEGAAHLTDGRHRLSAIVKSGVAVPLVVIRVWVRTLREIEEAYYRTDCNLKRPFSEAMPVNRLAREWSLDEGQVRVIEHAARFLASGGIDTRTSCRRLAERDKEVRYHNMEQWLPWGKAYFEGVEGASEAVRGALRAMPVVSVGMITFRYQRDRAREFWSRVAANEDLKRGMPEHTCVGVLCGEGEHKRAYNWHARMVAGCWSAAYQRRKLPTVQVADPKKPLLIAGTPHDGRAHFYYGGFEGT